MEKKMSDGMPIATTGGAAVLAATGAQAGLGWVVVAAVALVVAGAVLLRLRRRREKAASAR
jgi:LPXTG-motif cell wall-anchored protein